MSGNETNPEQAPEPIAGNGLCFLSTRWASLIARIYKLDPLRCLKCGATMVINPFIFNPPYLFFQ